MSCDSDRDPVAVTTTSGYDDWIKESHQQNGESNHGNMNQLTLEFGDSNNQTPSNDCTSNVNHGEPTNNTLTCMIVI